MDAALKRIKAAPKLAAFEAVRPGDRIHRRGGRSQEEEYSPTCAATLKPTAILASNTSSISITRLAAKTDRPDKFIGIHFMNPAPVMKLVEVIRGLATSQETYDTSVAFIESLGKNIANAEDFPAFIVNRVLVPMINEAIYTLVRRRGLGRSDRQSHEARRAPSNGPAGACGLHRPRHLSVDHAGALRRPGGLQVPPLPAAGEIRRSRLAWPQNQRGFYDYRTDPPTPTR